MTGNLTSSRQRTPWNKGRLIGQKRPLKSKDVWTFRVRLQLEGCRRDLAMFNLAIDSKLRGCDPMRLRVDEASAVVGRDETARRRSGGAIGASRALTRVPRRLLHRTVAAARAWSPKPPFMPLAAIRSRKVSRVRVPSTTLSL